ncbi:MAG TPA: hypothetical protein VIG47_15580 [Gemmatimonadaceae bacterium]|jgi:hypothetical protein
MYTYVGNGHFVSGVPARDISDAEFALLGDEERANVVSSGLYEHRAEDETAAQGEVSGAQDEHAEPAQASVEAASNIAEPAPVAPDAAEAPNAQSE